MDIVQRLAQAKEGFRSLSAPIEQQDEALKHLEHWLSQEVYAEYFPQIEWLLDTSAWSLLFDSFYRMIPFGTGGRRGPVGIGPNRINASTISTSVQGHIAYLRQLFPSISEQHVVIAYDVREFRDLRGRYNPELPNPLIGMSSQDLCHLAARIYAANGVTAHILPLEDNTFISTPELSFLIREYKAQGGLNISASHNHPDDNGGKFYNHLGGQPVPPEDENMLKLVQRVTEVPLISMEEAITRNRISWITPEYRERYVLLNAQMHGAKVDSDLHVVYSPMHGTGESSVAEACRKAGYSVQLMSSQATPDGGFPNVRFQMPNPEVREAMQDVIDWAQQQGADIALATDPDADRLGLAAVDAKGTWRFFTGNEIGALLAEHRLTRWKEEGNTVTPLVVKTEVTTGLIEKITEAHGGLCVGGLLVGFKYIGQALQHWEDGLPFHGVEGSLEQFALGTEESHGYLVSPDIRDKDAAGAAVLLVEYASRLKKKGSHLCEALETIYQTHGYYCNQLVSMVMEGASGVTNIRAMQSSLRQDPPQEIAGIPVRAFFDHQDTSGRLGEFVSETDRNGRNVLVFHLEGDIRLILRPSGTEPKAKVYIEVPSEPCADKEQLPHRIQSAQERAQAIAKVFTQCVLARIGIDLPMYALKTSDLVSIRLKRLFAEEILPAWQARISELGSELSTEAVMLEVEWLKNALLPYGKEAKTLLENGFEAFFVEHKEKGYMPSMRQIWSAFSV